MNVFQFLRVMFSTARTLNAKSKQADALSQLPIHELVTVWAARVNQPGVYHAALRSPCPGSVSSAEARLGFRLPQQLRSFYGVCDGLETSDKEHPYPIVRASALALAGAYTPSLSEQADAQWQEWGESDGDPRAFLVHPSGYLAAVTNRVEDELPFSFADSLIALYPPEGARCLCMVVRDSGCYGAGTVLEIENLTATRYASLSTWLAMSASAV